MMKMLNLLHQNIENITTVLIENNLAKAFNFPKIDHDRHEVIWSKHSSISFLLKNDDYKELYNKTIMEQEYNIVLLDGAIIQMMYRVNGDEIIEHRLLYMPSPHTPNYEDFSDDYTHMYYEEIFGDITNKSSMIFPIRFDYSNDKDKFEEISHPYSHLTLGNFSNCRIPIISPITPYTFIIFILRNFYNTLYVKNPHIETSFSCTLNINNTITENEKKILHFSYTT